MEAQKKSWGGHRLGAGRKAQENARSIRASFMLSPKAAEALAKYAEAHSITRNAAINEILESLCLKSRGKIDRDT